MIRVTKKKEVKIEQPPKPAEKIVVQNTIIDNTEVLKAIEKLTKVVEDKEFDVDIPTDKTLSIKDRLLLQKNFTILKTSVDSVIKLVKEKSNTVITSEKSEIVDVEFTIFRNPQGQIYKIIGRPIN